MLYHCVRGFFFLLVFTRVNVLLSINFYTITSLCCTVLITLSNMHKKKTTHTHHQLHFQPSGEEEDGGAARRQDLRVLFHLNAEECDTTLTYGAGMILPPLPGLLSSGPGNDKPYIISLTTFNTFTPHNPCVLFCCPDEC